MNNRIFSLFAITSLFLTACSHSPVSYLPVGSTPIVNIETPLAEQLQLETQPLAIKIRNVTHQTLGLSYKLFWYDQEGVSQNTPNERWQALTLMPNTESTLPLTKPNVESVNYRIYLKENR